MRLFTSPFLFLFLVVLLFGMLKVQDNKTHRIEIENLALDDEIDEVLFRTFKKLDTEKKLTGYLVIEYQELIARIDNINSDYQ